MRRVIVLVLSTALVIASCTGAAEDTTTTVTEASTTATVVPTSEGSTTTTTPQGISVGLRPAQPFATFPEIPLLGDTPPYAGPATPTSLDGVLWADQVPEAAHDLLAANGFVVVESGYGQFHEAYSHVEMSSRQPLYVTSDAAYHYWHLAFAKALRDTEQQVLLPILEQFAVELNRLAEEQEAKYEGTAIRAETAQVLLYSQLLLALLELDDGPFPDEVEAELALIREHAGKLSSPTTGAEVDYSLFRPRGHYTITPELTRFFLTMSSLGQTGFVVGSPDQLRTGLMLARLIDGSEELTGWWETLYDPTAFLVGLADDYTPFELLAAADTIRPGWEDDPTLITGDADMSALGEQLASVRPVAIDPANASMRVMGARYVLDSYILDQLVYPNVMEGGDRLEASPLDVAAAFGSEWAHQQQVEAGEPEKYPEYEPQLEEMTELVAARETDDWAGTVYDGWLYAIQPVWNAHGEAYPDFMRTEVWAAKAHNAGFGSYTELKHDTILYAKQAFAEGEAPSAPAEPRHWVEPEPVVYARLAAVARLMQQGLSDRDLLADEVAEILDQLTAIYDNFARLAEDELAGEPITTEDNQWLETIGSSFELLWLLAAEDVGGGGAGTGGFPASPNDIAALVADIMSNPSQALEIGTGYIDQIYVLVPNDEGQFQVARGGVYSYYEFWVPRDQRLTDDEWRQMLSSGEAPERPDWTEVFLGEQS
ncbi:MAG TPA: DUF3160 domain-containing protein [Acidimicrobiia bacterium]|jgi:hypothetical protein